MSAIGVDSIRPSAGGTARSIRGIATAWANINGTGTISIRGSLNISSIVDVAQGAFRYNYSSLMSNGNYKALVSGSSPTLAAPGDFIIEGGILTSRVETRHVENSALMDPDIQTIDTHGDLA